MVSLLRLLALLAEGAPAALPCARPLWICALSAGPADGVGWWLAQALASFAAATLLAAAPALFRRHQLAAWAALDLADDSAARRSVLVTSDALRGLLLLVPDSEQVSEAVKTADALL